MTETGLTAVAPVESQLAIETYTYWRAAQTVESADVDAMANLVLNQLAQNGSTVSLRRSAMHTLLRMTKEQNRT